MACFQPHNYTHTKDQDVYLLKQATCFSGLKGMSCMFPASMIDIYALQWAWTSLRLVRPISNQSSSEYLLIRVRTVDVFKPQAPNGQCTIYHQFTALQLVDFLKWNSLRCYKIYVRYRHRTIRTANINTVWHFHYRSREQKSFWTVQSWWKKLITRIMNLYDEILAESYIIASSHQYIGSLQIFY